MFAVAALSVLRRGDPGDFGAGDAIRVVERLQHETRERRRQEKRQREGSECLSVCRPQQTQSDAPDGPAAAVETVRGQGEEVEEGDAARQARDRPRDLGVFVAASGKMSRSCSDCLARTCSMDT